RASDCDFGVALRFFFADFSAGRFLRQGGGRLFFNNGFRFIRGDLRSFRRRIVGWRRGRFRLLDRSGRRRVGRNGWRRLSLCRRLILLFGGRRRGGLLWRRRGNNRRRARDHRRGGCVWIGNADRDADRFFSLANALMSQIGRERDRGKSRERNDDRRQRHEFCRNTPPARQGGNFWSRQKRHAEFSRHRFAALDLRHALLDLPVNRQRILRPRLGFNRQHLGEDAPHFLRHPVQLVDGEPDRSRLHGERPFRRHQGRRAREQKPHGRAE